MRRVLMAGAAVLALAVPAMAFDFTAKALPDVLDGRLAALDFPTRVFLIGCNPAEGGDFCILRAGKGVSVYVHTPHGASQPDFVGTIWDRSPQTETAFDQATIALVTLCSPGATSEERDRTMHALLDPIDKAGSKASGENDSWLDGNLFVSKLEPGTGLLIKVMAGPGK